MKKAFWVIFALLCVDALTKLGVHTQLPPMQWATSHYPYGGIGIFENFFGIECSLVNVTNRGAAWGQFASWHTPLLIVRICVVVAIGIYMLQKKHWGLPLLLIVGGALGNIIDCFVYGHVVDMFHFVFWGYSYPVFNVADSAICIGAVVLLLQKRRKVAHA